MSRTDQFPVTSGARYSASLSPACARTKSCHATSRRSNDCSRFTLHPLLAGYRIRFTMSRVVILAALEGMRTVKRFAKERGRRAGDGPPLSLLSWRIRGTGTRAWPGWLGDGRKRRTSAREGCFSRSARRPEGESIPPPGFCLIFMAERDANQAIGRPAGRAFLLRLSLPAAHGAGNWSLDGIWRKRTRRETIGR